MQVEITAAEKRTIKKLTEPHGKTAWFCNEAGIKWDALQRLRKIGLGDEENVKKVRAFLQKQESDTAVSA